MFSCTEGTAAFRASTYQVRGRETLLIINDMKNIESHITLLLSLELFNVSGVPISADKPYFEIEISNLEVEGGGSGTPRP